MANYEGVRLCFFDHTPVQALINFTY